MSEVTRILSAIEEGDPRAAEQLLPLVYDELRRLAAQKLARETPGQTLQATALVHEAYLRLVGNQSEATAPGWNSRGHFFAAAAEAMRRILVDQARHKHTAKAGGDRRRIELNDIEPAVKEPDVDLLALHDALDRLEADRQTQGRSRQAPFLRGLDHRRGRARARNLDVDRHNGLGLCSLLAASGSPGRWRLESDLTVSGGKSRRDWPKHARFSHCSVGKGPHHAARVQP